MWVFIVLIVIIYFAVSNRDEKIELNDTNYGENFKYAISNMQLPKLKKVDHSDKMFTFNMDEALKYINGDSVAEYVSTKTSTTGAGIVLGNNVGIGLGNAGSKTDVIVTQNDAYITSVQLKIWVEDGVLDAKIENNDFYFNKRDLDDLIKQIDIAIKPANRAYEIYKYFGDNDHILERYSTYSLHEILYEINDKTFDNVLKNAVIKNNKNRTVMTVVLGISIPLIICVTLYVLLCVF